MLKKTLMAVLIAGLGSSAGLLLEAQSASAMPIGYAPVAASTYSNIQAAAWVYVPARHGARFKVRHPGYGYFYGGWWYARPWWTIGVGPVVVEPVYRPIYGPRYLVRRPGYVYFHGGYWYRRRWW